MKMKFHIFFILLLTKTLLSPKSAQFNAYDEVDNALQTVIKNGQAVGIAAGAISGDSPTVLLNHGYANQVNKTLFTTKTITRTASISKPMTAIAIMQLLESGKVSLDDTVSKYYPKIKETALRNVTIKQLLAQTTGIPAYKNKKEAENTTVYNTLEKASEVFIYRKPLFEPGRGFHYSTYNYTLVGIVIEKVSGLSFEEYMQKNIFEPAGMTSTSVENIKSLPVGKSKIYKRVKKNKFRQVNDHSLSDRIPGGGIQSTVEDILSFAKAIYNYELISEESLRLMITNSGMKKEGNPYGMGWFLYGRGDNGSVIGHSGAQLGCSSFMFILPEIKVASVVLSNTPGVEQTVKIANDLFLIATKDSRRSDN